MGNLPAPKRIKIITKTNNIDKAANNSNNLDNYNYNIIVLVVTLIILEVFIYDEE